MSVAAGPGVKVETMKKWEDYKNMGRGFPASDKDFRSRLDQICRAVGSREEAAKAAGISVNQLIKYIKGKTNPSFFALANLVSRTPYSLDWLATGQDEEVSVRSKIAEHTDHFEPRIVWNVAYFLAGESTLIKADPTSLADTIISLSEYIKNEEAEDASTGKVMSFAAAQIKKANNDL